MFSKRRVNILSMSLKKFKVHDLDLKANEGHRLVLKSLLIHICTVAISTKYMYQHCHNHGE